MRREATGKGLPRLSSSRTALFFASLMCPVALLTRYSLSVSLKTFCHEAQGCSKFTARGPDRYQAKGNITALTFCNLTQIEITMTQPLGLVWPLLVLKGRDRARVGEPEPLVVEVRRVIPLEIGDSNDRLVLRERKTRDAETEKGRVSRSL